MRTKYSIGIAIVIAFILTAIKLSKFALPTGTDDKRQLAVKTLCAVKSVFLSLVLASVRDAVL